MGKDFALERAENNDATGQYASLQDPIEAMRTLINKQEMQAIVDFIHKKNFADDAESGAPQGELSRRAESVHQLAVVNTENVLSRQANDGYGGTLSIDARGNKAIIYKDGARRVENTDGTGYTLTPNSDGSFAQHNWYPAPEHFWHVDRNKHPDRRLSAEQVLAMDNANLLSDAQHYIKDPEELKTFQDNMQVLEARSARDGISAGQMALTYAHIDTLLRARGDIGTNDFGRVVLAEQVMALAADPLKNSRQGGYNTCGAADIEFAMYTRHPEAAAPVVADVALSGKYVARDGTTVAIDMTPQGESAVDRDADYTMAKRGVDRNERSYASQLFQVATLNVALTKFAPSLNVTEAKYYQDAQGEGVDYTQNGVKMHEDSFGMSQAMMTTTYEAMSGGDKLTVIRQSSSENTVLVGAAPVVKSEAQFNEILKQAKTPVMVFVNADNEPFEQPVRDKNGHYWDRDESGHSIVITAVDFQSPQKAKQLQVYNTQGQDIVFGKGGQISAHDLYLSTLTRKDEIAALRQDLRNERKSGHVETWKELTLVRLEIEEKRISRAEAQRRLNEIIAHLPSGQRLALGVR